MKLPTRIPTLIGILFVIVLVGGLGFAFEHISRGATTASGSAAPAHVEMTNISDAGFTVSWITEAPATGVISVESPPSKHTVFDERDISGKLGTYMTHSVSVRNARADTQYSFKILSNGKTYLASGGPYIIRTAPALSSQSSALEPAFGMVLGESSLAADGALLYITPQGGQTLSTLVKPSGSWLVPLNLARTSDLLSYLPLAERIDEDIIVRFGSTETIAITDTLNDNPVPDMTIGKTYDFRKQQAKALTTPSVLGQSTQTASTVFAITAPAQNAALTTNLPLIQGTGSPGKTVSITIGITNPLSGTTTVGSDGIWRYTPTQRLTPGKQSVTATSVGVNGQATAITHIFEVLKSGTQVLGDATPSGTLTATPSPIATQTATLAGDPVPTSGTALPAIILTLLGLTIFTTGGVLMATRESKI